MTDILSQIQTLQTHTSNLSSEDIIYFQQTLAHNKFAILPADFINFLYKYNTINYNGKIICGILHQDNYADILTLNKKVNHPLHKDLVFLGYDDLDYFAYNQKHKCYQIIDKLDFEVLEEYPDFSNTLQHILKIEDE